MKKILDDVRAFHEATGVPVRTVCRLPLEDRVDLRQRLHNEENGELNDAIDAQDLPAIAKEIVDLMYVLAGTALEFGIPLDKVWDEVHRSNMAKVDSVTGRVRYREDGKVLKPEGWTPPDIAKVLEAEVVS